ncbi:MAG: L-lactate dehydrogenase (cytochrome) [Hyphomicrobiaceae bacterium]|jgi:L-lactate dehydrogenase (cytochrome)
MSIEQCYNLDDFRKLARRRLPSPLFHFMDGGADDETTLRGNTSAFDACQLLPSTLADISDLDISTTVLGHKIDWPVIMAPTGINRLFHHEGERAVARAAAKSGTIYSLSTMSNVSIEEIGALTTGPKCFQIYIHRDRGLTREFVQRTKAAGFDSLCLTVDTLVAGNRERDLKTGMIMPPKLTLKSLASFATHWRWAYNYLTSEKFELANLTNNQRAGAEKLISVIDYVNSQFDPSITWADAEELIAQWDGPFAVKGIMTAADAKRAVDIGATAILVSNHGGRQLDGAPSAFECLADIADAVGGKADIILDGGIRRGSHVLKALAMGADACSIGRGYLYPLAAGGEAGVTRALSQLRAEIERDMILMGCDRVAKLDRSKLRASGLDVQGFGGQVTAQLQNNSAILPRVVA